MATVSVPHPSRVPSPDIIDVDALEEDAMVYTGFREPPGRSSQHQPHSGQSLSAYESLDDEITFTGFSRRSPRRAPRHTSSAHAGPSSSAGTSGDNVIVLDSDDETPSSSFGGRRPNIRTVSRSRLMSPPPPAAQRGHTPGVPPLPPHLASQASLPRQHRAPDIPPPIRPVSQPLVFEDRLRSLPRLLPRNIVPPPPAAPRSHHQPVMGLGGALIALNRQNSLHDVQRANQARAQAEARFNLPTFTEMLGRMIGFGGDAAYVPAPPENNARRWRHRIFPWYWDDGALDSEQELLSPFGDDDGLLGLPARLDAHRPAIDLRHYLPKTETVSMWKPEYTHPDKIAPGFTHDFAPSEEPSSQTSSSSSPRAFIVLDEDEAGPSGSASGSSSATAVETTLVCARCLDPLILAPADNSSEDQVKTRRVWAMRCGHMLDGKCVAELMSPPEARVEIPPTQPFEDACVDSKGKGKARAEVETPSTAAHTSDFPPSSPRVASMDRKGKRKAVEPLEPAEPPKRPAFPADPAEPTAEANVDDSIRSRLRSRTRTTVADVSPSSALMSRPLGHVMSEEGDESPFAPPHRRGRRQPAGTSARSHGHGRAEVRGKGKGKARAKVERKPVVEAEHEWRCPVSGCGCAHYSVRVEGRWTNDEGRGPIALFV
ncbi:hypothetical protein BC628DRAFT_1307944 [Trametes gibbosa]|nr:hypothetical protein BC628DRAFT_1307944 [Trametes gibbosa]